MVTKEQILNGLVSYVDSYIMPELPTSGKWAMGTGVFLLMDQYNSVFKSVTQNPTVKALKVVDSSGNVDIDKLSAALKQSAEKYGKASFTIPIIGTLTFSADDIDKLNECIKGDAEV